MKIKRFGEKGDDKWYELIDGTRIKCNENDIHDLWQYWIISESKRYYEDGFLVFEFEKLNNDNKDERSVATEDK